MAQVIDPSTVEHYGQFMNQASLELSVSEIDHLLNIIRSSIFSGMSRFESLTVSNQIHTLFQMIQEALDRHVDYKLLDVVCSVGDNLYSDEKSANSRIVISTHQFNVTGLIAVPVALLEDYSMFDLDKAIFEIEKIYSKSEKRTYFWEY